MDAVKQYYLDQLRDMQALVGGTRHLRSVFPRQWFEEVEKIILDWDGSGSLDMSRCGAFGGYIHTRNEEGSRNVINQLDRAFASIKANTGKALKTKLRLIAGSDLSNYFSTVFETLVVGQLSKAGVLVEYEPNIGSGVPEGRIMLSSGASALVEARATADISVKNCAFDPADYGKKLLAKVGDKCRAQLSSAREPVVLCVALNAGALWIHFEYLLKGIQGGYPLVSAVFGADTYLGGLTRAMQAWVNPSATLRLSQGDYGALRDALGAEDFLFSGLV